MDTPQTDLADASTPSRAQEQSPESNAKKKKGSYNKITSFIFERLLLGEQFVTDFQHNRGVKQHDADAEKGKKKRGRGTHKTPNGILYKMPARSLGLFFASFGFILLFLCIFGERLLHTHAFPFSAYVSAVVALIFGLSLVPFGMPIASLFSKSRLLTFLLCDLLLMKKLRMTVEPFSRSIRHLSTVLAVVFGIMLSFLSFFVSPVRILCILLLLAFVCAAFAAPECCLVIAAFILPWLSFFNHPSTVLGGLTLLLILSFFCKVLRHKRTFTFTLPDALVLILAGLYLLGGVHALGSGFYRSHGALYALLIFVYFPASNLLRDRRILFHTAHMPRPVSDCNYRNRGPRTVKRPVPQPESPREFRQTDPPQSVSTGWPFAGRFLS